MNTAKAITATAGVLLLFSFVKKGRAYGALNYYPAGVKNVYIEGASPAIVIGIKVQNTSSEQIIVRSLAGNLYSDDIGEQLLGNVSNFQTISINTNSQVVLNLKIILSPVTAVNDIIRAFTNQNFTVKIRFVGNINVDNIQLPLHLNYSIGL